MAKYLKLPTESCLLREKAGFSRKPIDGDLPRTEIMALATSFLFFFICASPLHLKLSESSSSSVIKSFVNHFPPTIYFISSIDCVSLGKTLIRAINALVIFFLFTGQVRLNICTHTAGLKI